MSSKTYKSVRLRRLSWPTLIDSNSLMCKSQTMINFSDQQHAGNYKGIRLKIKTTTHLNTDRELFKPNSTFDNLFKSIRKRKLKHPINCFNRKNSKFHFLLTCPTNAQDYLRLLNFNGSIRSRIKNLKTQSAFNLTNLNNLANPDDFESINGKEISLRHSKSSIDEFELFKMVWLRAIRSSIGSNPNQPKRDDSYKSSFNNLIKLDFKIKDWKNHDSINFFENSKVQLSNYGDTSSNKEFIKDYYANDKSSESKVSIDIKPSKDFTKNELKVPDLFYDDFSTNELFNQNQFDSDEKINLENNINEAILFPVGEWCLTDCEVCFQECWLHRRICCNYAVCSNCLSQYFQERVSLGLFSIECVNNRCHELANRNEISISLETKYKEIYHNLLRTNNDLGKLTRTCPNCNFIHKLKDNSELKKMRKKRKKDPTVSRVKCRECGINWCFLCHAPWHQNISCKKFIAGDRLLRDWAKQFNGGQVNAQRCPTCKTFIQRISGCDHMHCSNCDTDFCYKCGEKLRRLKFFGNHYSKLSVFGCKYRYKANQPALRKTIRFTVFCAKLAATPALGSAIIAALGIALTIGIAALPVYAVLRSARWIFEQRTNKKKKINKMEPFHVRSSLKNNKNSTILKNTSSKLDNFNGQQYIQNFSINNSMNSATFTQNANWLANYGLMADLNSSTLTPSARFTGFDMDGLNSLTSDNNKAKYQIKTHKHRKPQTIF